MMGLGICVFTFAFGDSDAFWRLNCMAGDFQAKVQNMRV